MPVYKVDAVVLRHQPVGEADRVLTLFTRQHGKMRVSARGVRRTTSRLSGRVQPYTHGRFLLARGRTLDVVAQAEPARAFPGLQDHLLRSAYAAYVAELVDRFLPERDAHPELFETVLQALTVIEQAGDEEAEVYALWFALHLADALGYRPETSRCVACGRALPAGRPSPEGDSATAVRGTAAWGFSPASGGAVCPACIVEAPSAARVAPGVLAIAGYLLAGDTGRARRLRVPERQRRDLDALVQAHLEYHLDGRLRAPRVIARLRGG